MDTVSKKYNIPDCTKCPYFSFPRLEDEWEYDEESNYKKRIQHGKYKCLYSGEEIGEWSKLNCPLQKK